MVTGPELEGAGAGTEQAGSSGMGACMGDRARSLGCFIHMRPWFSVLGVFAHVAACGLQPPGDGDASVYFRVLISQFSFYEHNASTGPPPPYTSSPASAVPGISLYAMSMTHTRNSESSGASQSDLVVLLATQRKLGRLIIDETSSTAV